MFQSAEGVQKIYSSANVKSVLALCEGGYAPLKQCGPVRLKESMNGLRKGELGTPHYSAVPLMCVVAQLVTVPLSKLLFILPIARSHLAR